MVKPIRCIEFRARDIQRIRANAAAARYTLCQKHLPSENDIMDYAIHIGDKLKNPTRGMIAMREQFVNRQIPAVYDRNKAYLETKAEMTKFLNESFEKKMENLYPRTRNIREYLINSRRVTFDEITKASKRPKFINKLIYLIFK